MIKTLAIVKFLLFVQLSCIGDIPKNQAHRIAESCLVNLAACIVAIHAPVDLPVISNLRDKGIVNTGFMIGTAGSNTSSVEVSLDNGAYTPAVGTTSWKFQFPTGSSTWRDNSQHTISVRTKNSNGNTSTAIAITVRKGTNKDINGDGYEDVIVGANQANSVLGKAYIFLGSASGIASANDTSANTTLTGTAANGQFGFSLAMGDVNGDGYADVIVGASGVSSLLGKAYIFLGGDSGIISSNDTSANTILTGTAANGAFGGRVAMGDANGDGYADVIVAAAKWNADFGRTYIFHGGSGGIANLNDTSANTTITGTVYSGLGFSVGMGDINGDGYGDLIVGAYVFSSLRGKTYIFHGSASGIANANDTAANTTITGTTVNSQFGRSVALGDINGDGYEDMIIGAIYAGSNGRAYIFHGGASGISNANDTAANTILTGTAASLFSVWLAMGDINADGFADIIIGEHDFGGVGFGKAFIFHGSVSGITNSNDTAAKTTITGTAVNGYLGSVAMSDINGDGYADAVVGAFGVSSFLGKAYIFHGGVSGIANSNDTAAKTILSGTSSGNFGGSIY